MRWAGEHPHEHAAVTDITESKGFQQNIVDSGFFSDVRNAVLSLCVDGVNPWEQSQYSMWPIIITVLNLPPDLRGRPEAMLLLGIIPGPGAPKSLNPYLELLVDELIFEGTDGVMTFDAYREEYFELHARLLPFVADYPGSGKTLCMKGSGAICGCMKCHVRGTPCSEESSKKVYDGFRRWLPADHAFRTDRRFGAPETRPAPAMRTHSDVVAKAEASMAAYLEFGVQPDSTADPAKATGVTGYCELFRLPYWNVVQNVPIELMHILVSTH
jgi:hypothetical protein